MVGPIHNRWAAIGRRIVKAVAVLLAVMPASTISSQAISAEIEQSQIDDDLALIFLTGELELGDEEIFRDRVVDVGRAIVVLHSPGGNLFAGLEIGRTLRLKGFSTWIPDGHECASACALAWLAGRVRYLSPNARLGFHAAYENSETGPRERGHPNAQIGAYLNWLDLTSRAIYCVTIAPPDSMKWLSIEDTAACGIEVEPRAGPPQRKRDPPSVQRSNPLVAQRAIYYFQGAVGEPGRAHEASVVWNRIIDGGNPAIQATIKLSQSDTTAMITFRPNEDASLPASHLIEVRFVGKLERSIIERVPAVVLKKSEQDRGEPLTGAAVPLNNDIFWIALPDEGEHVRRNLQLLTDGAWFDLPIIFQNGTRGLLTFEKGVQGEKVFRGVLSEWAGDAKPQEQGNPGVREEPASICTTGCAEVPSDRGMAKYCGARRTVENGFILELRGVDFPGADYDSLAGIPQKDCIMLCNISAICRACTYNRSAKHCFLKNEWREAQAHIDAYSGLKCFVN